MTNTNNKKVALVTGASSGIGRATAIAFAQEGSFVAVSDVDQAGGLQTVKLIEQLGKEAAYYPCDVSKENEVKSLIQSIVTKWGRLDFAFNNAGVEGQQAFTPDCTDDNWEKVIGINLKGVWLCMKYEIPVMLKQGGGSIVNCASIAGLLGFPGIPAYAASKHGVIGLTRTAALEYAKSNIRVNAVCPGVIQTPMIDRFTHGEARIQKQLVAGEPVGRVGTPEEIASAVLWMCSDGASFVTGHPLVVDGGWVAQ